MADWVIILGGRGAALDAALALDLNILLITEPTTAKRVVSKAHAAIAISLRAPFANILSQIQQQLPQIKPNAVIAVSEQGVLPAAKLRAYFNLSGQNVASAQAALVKSEMKKRFMAAGLPCWPTTAIDSVEQAVELADQYGYPLVVKALASSGSRGFRVIKDRNRLRQVVKNMLLRPEYGGIGMEPYCSAKECSVELILQNGKPLFYNVTDYLVAAQTNLLPAKFSKDFEQRLYNLCLGVVAAFEFNHGMLHIEFYYQQDQLWIGEVNARPPGGGLMDLINLAYDCDCWKMVIQSQLTTELKIQPFKKQRYAANWIIHPGKGVVRAIDGCEQLAAHPLTKLFNLKLKIGQTVYRREGTGSSVGELRMVSNDHRKLSQAILASMQTLQISIDKNKGQPVK